MPLEAHYREVMKKLTKIFLGLALLIIASAIPVPLGFTCGIMVSESPVTKDQIIRLHNAVNILWVISLLMQCGGAWLLLGRPFRPLRFAMLAAGCIIGSFAVGIIFAAHAFPLHWWQTCKELSVGKLQ